MIAKTGAILCIRAQLRANIESAIACLPQPPIFHRGFWLSGRVLASDACVKFCTSRLGAVSRALVEFYRALFAQLMDAQLWLKRVTSKDLWRRSIPAVLDRVGFDADYVRAYCEPTAPDLPPAAAAYLQSSNPRLQELRLNYAKMPADAIKCSQWTRAYVEQDLPLHRFRGDCAFVWQHRNFNLPVTYALSYYYLLAQGLGPLLNALGEDGLFGAYTVTVANTLVSRDRLDSACELSFLSRRLGVAARPHAQILDIGSGYGRLAHRAAQAFPSVSVACVDAIAEASFVCEYYLRFRQAPSRVRMVPLFEIEEWLRENPVDVAVNIHSFPECCSRSIAWWLDLLRVHSVPYLLIVPNSDGHAGQRLLSLEEDGSRTDFTGILTSHGYRLVAMEPKYSDSFVQRFGVTPTRYHLYELTC